MNDLIMVIVCSIALSIIVILLLKSFWISYFDIDKIKKNQLEQLEVLKEISEQLKKNSNQ